MPATSWRRRRRPARSTIFNADWLAAAAREHDLAWQPGSRFDRATVERATRIVGADAVPQRLRQEIAATQPVDDAQLQLDNAALHLLVAKDAPDTIAVDGLTLDPRSGRFTALVSAPAGDAAAERQRVTGRLIRIARCRRSTARWRPGEIIAARDIETIELRADRVAPDLDRRRAASSSARRRAIRSTRSEPLRAFDVAAPLVVRKDDLVTDHAGDAEPAAHRARQGARRRRMGATIRVANTKSNRVIDATVTGHNLVTVAAPALLAGR